MTAEAGRKKLLERTACCVGLLFAAQSVLAQYPNIRVSDTTVISPNEVTIAINPANPLQLAAGSNLRYYYYSTDGGQTWKSGRLSSSLNVWGDPSVIFDRQGNLYYGHLSGTPASVPPAATWLDRIVVQRSTDGGVSWDDGVGIGFNPPRQQDKEWLAADCSPASPYLDNVYAAWTEFDKYGSKSPADSSRILLAHSTDAGGSWSVPVRVSDRAGDCVDSDSTVEGAVPAIGPNGEVYVGWSGAEGILFDVSTDGGRTFGTDRLIATQPGGWDFEVEGIDRCNGFPVTACDVSTSPYRGTVYVSWADQRNGPGNADVYLIRSTDQGTTWGPVRRVNSDTTARQQFFSWMTVDPASGNLYFVFYDRRETTGLATDVYCARSTDGGETFQNFKVSTSSFVPTSSVFFGDYINIAALNGKIYPIWMRLDGTLLTIWTALVTDPVSVNEHGGQTGPAALYLEQNYPDPFNATTRIRFSVGQAERVRLSIFDLIGREVAVLRDGVLSSGQQEAIFDGSRLASGVYICRLRSSTAARQQRMILLK